jgi:hypothetical protein
MLSASNTITDVKVHLRPYAFYGLASDAAFSAILPTYVEEARLRYLLPALGAAEYNTIAAKDKVGLSEEQNYLYQAEVYISAGLFLESRDEQALQSFQGDSVSGSVDGVSRSVSGIHNSGIRAAARALVQKGLSFMAFAGYGQRRLLRGAGPFQPVQERDGRLP